MYIDKYKNEWGEYEYDGCTYPNALSVLYATTGRNFCTCGDEYAGTKYLYDILVIMKGEDRWDNLKSFFKSHEERTFALWMIDGLGLSEHGSSIYGSFLSSKGVEFLRDLEYIMNNWEECT